jgi:tRNA A-37 threonylcarbamoyl transferase component Bud32
VATPLPRTPERLVAGELDWHVEPDELGAVRDLLAPAARDELPGEVVKSNPARQVRRVATSAGELYVKLYFARNGTDRAKHVLGRSKALAEFEAMRRLRAAGVSTAVALAAGDRASSAVIFGPSSEGDRRIPASAFLSRAVPGARGFPSALDALRVQPDGARRVLIEKLAALALAIARAGADHRDLHVGNVLVDGRGELVIIDLHAVSFPATLGRGRRVERLSRLALSLGAVHEDRKVAAWGREEVGWLVAEAVRLDPELGPAPELERALNARARTLLERHLASRDRRCLVDSKGFAVEVSDGRSVFRRREVPLDAVLAALEAPALALIHAHARGRSVLERVAGGAGFPGDLVRKREDYPGLRSRLGAFFRGTRARAAWLAARALEVRGLPAPRVFALVEARALGVVPARSYLLMEHLGGTTMVHVYLMETLKQGHARKRQALARELGRVVARLHARGLVHRDLAVQNVLLRETAGGFDLFFVDLDEVRVREPSEKDALRALVQIADLPPAASRSDKLRGFRAYLEEGGAPAFAALVAREGEKKVLARIVAALAQRAVDKKRRAARRRVGQDTAPVEGK